MRKLLKKGDSGEDVKLLQKALKLKVDGSFGPKTEEAVKVFQGINGMVIDGIAGPKTQSAIFKEDIKKYMDTQMTVPLFETILLDDDEYHHGPASPAYIYLHHTAGWHNPINTIKDWNNDSRGKIATEFIIGGPSIRGNDNTFDGRIIKCMPDGGYAAHLGNNGSQAMHNNSVGIEVCNFGQLTKTDAGFKTYSGALVHESQVCDLGYKWRGFQYWHKYSTAQIEALKDLILFIASRNNIDVRIGLKEFLKTEDPATAFDFKKDAWSGKIKGILSHSNIRKDKTDMFPQPELVDMLRKL